MTLQIPLLASAIAAAHRLDQRLVGPLTSALGRTTEATWGPGDLLLRAGEANQGLLLLASGTVRVLLPDGPPHEAPQLSGPCLLGQLSVVDDSPRSATLEALTDCVGLHLGATEARALLAETTAAGDAFRELLHRSIFLQLADVTLRLRTAMRNRPGQRIDLA